MNFFNIVFEDIEIQNCSKERLYGIFACLRIIQDTSKSILLVDRDDGFKILTNTKFIPGCLELSVANSLEYNQNNNKLVRLPYLNEIFRNIDLRKPILICTRESQVNVLIFENLEIVKGIYDVLKLNDLGCFLYINGRRIDLSTDIIYNESNDLVCQKIIKIHYQTDIYEFISIEDGWKRKILFDTISSNIEGVNCCILKKINENEYEII